MLAFLKLGADFSRWCVGELIGHSILTISYYLLTRHTTYQDLGHNYFDERDREGVKRRAVRRLEQLGFQVTLAPPPQVPT